jgi:hypothetical protein
LTIDTIAVVDRLAIEADADHKIFLSKPAPLVIECPVRLQGIRDRLLMNEGLLQLDHSFEKSTPKSVGSPPARRTPLRSLAGK